MHDYKKTLVKWFIKSHLKEGMLLYKANAYYNYSMSRN